jgi:hypothetical protein
MSVLERDAIGAFCQRSNRATKTPSRAETGYYDQARHPLCAAYVRRDAVISGARIGAIPERFERALAEDIRVIPGAGGSPRGQTSAPFRRPLARRAAARIGRALLSILVGYDLLSLALLAVYRFVEPPTTAVQFQRRVEVG